MPQSYPGPYNVIGSPSLEATGDLIVSYSRHPNQFPLNEYIKLAPVDVPWGLWLYVDPQQAIRITADNAYDWADGEFRPGFNDLDPSNNLQILFQQYLCKRYNYPSAYGEITIQQANAWDLPGQQTGQLATKAMVKRTKIVQGQLSAQALPANTTTATNAGGGFWSAGAIGTPYIRESIAYGARLILAATAGAVSYKDLVLVVSPKVAVAMANSDEVFHYISNQASSPEIQREAGNNRNWTWQLPTELYGVKLVVEDTQINTNLVNSPTQTVSDVMDDNTAYLMARPGSLVAASGSNFSTVCLMVYKKFEMLLETQEDSYNHLWRANLSDMIDAQVVGPQALIKYTSVLS